MATPVVDAPFVPNSAFFPDGINPTLSDSVTGLGVYIQANQTGIIKYVSGKSLTTAIWIVPFAGALLRTRVSSIFNTTTNVPATAIQIYGN